MTKFSKLAAAAALVMAAAGAQAAFVIDDFSLGQADLSDFANGVLPVNTAAYGTDLASGVGSTSGLSGSIIGTQRDLMVYKVNQTGTAASRAVTGGVDGGLFTFSSPAQTSGFAVLRWDGAGTSFNQALSTSGLGGVDLSSFGFGIRVKSQNDLAYDITLQAWTEETVGNWVLKEKTVSAPSSSSSQQNIDFLFSSASFLGADFSRVGALQLIVNTGALTSALDVDIDIIANVVPEPGTLALAGAALLGLAAARRRKNTA